MKSPFIYLHLIGLTKIEEASINFYLINVPATILLVVQEISNWDRRVADGDVVNGWRWKEKACLTVLDLCAWIITDVSSNENEEVEER